MCLSWTPDIAVSTHLNPCQGVSIAAWGATRGEVEDTTTLGWTLSCLTTSKKVPTLAIFIIFILILILIIIIIANHITLHQLAITVCLLYCFSLSILLDALDTETLDLRPAQTSWMSTCR
jgi:hypothetical protein